MSLRAPQAADVQNQGRLLDVLRGLYDAITGNRSSLTELTTLVVNVDGINADAAYWLSTANAGLPSGINMGALGTGVLEQTSDGTTATPQARALDETAILFGGPAGLIDFDVALLTYARALNMFTVAGSADEVAAVVHDSLDTGRARMRLANELGLEQLGTDATASVDFTGGAYAGDDLPNAMVFRLPLPGFGTGGNGWTWREGDMTAMRLPWNDDTFELDVMVSRPAHTGGRAGYAMTNNIGLQARQYLTCSVNTIDGPNLLITRYAGDAIYDLGSMTVTALGAGGIVWANPGTSPAGLLSLVTIGSGLSFSGGTLSATGGTGTVTDVFGDAPITSTGGTVPHIGILDFVASGASHARGAVPDPGAVAGTAKFLREDATWAVPPSSGGTVTGVTGTAPIVVTPASPNPNVSLNIDGSLGVSAGALQRAALTGDASASAGSNALTLATVNSSPGTFAYATVTVNGKGLATSVSAGATPVLPTRRVDTTAPLTGGGDLSADRTLGINDFVASGASHARGAVPDPGAVAGVTKFLCENATWAVPPGTGQPVITWPTAGKVLYSTGTTTDPAGDARFIWDTTNRGLAIGNAGVGALGNMLYVLQGTTTRASAAGLTVDSLLVDAATVTLTGTTHITTAGGVNQVTLKPLTLTDGSAVTVDLSATLAITGPSAQAGSVTIGQPMSLWIQSGASVFNGFLGANAIGSEGAANGTYAFSVLGNTSRDKIWLGVGGKQLTASGSYAYIDVDPLSTSIVSGGGGISLGTIATMRIRSAPWSGGGSGGATIAEMASLYVDGAPGVPAATPTLSLAVHVAGGMARFDGTVQENIGAPIAVSGTTSIGFNGDGNSHLISGSAAPVVTGVSVAASQRPGERQVLIFTNSVTVKHLGTGPVQFSLTAGADLAAVAGTVLEVINDGTVWRQI